VIALDRKHASQTAVLRSQLEAALSEIAARDGALQSAGTRVAALEKRVKEAEAAAEFAAAEGRAAAEVRSEEVKAAAVKSAEAPRRRDVTALTERAVAAEGEASAWAERAMAAEAAMAEMAMAEGVAELTRSADHPSPARSDVRSRSPGRSELSTKVASGGDGGGGEVHVHYEQTVRGEVWSTAAVAGFLADAVAATTVAADAAVNAAAATSAAAAAAAASTSLPTPASTSQQQQHSLAPDHQQPQQQQSPQQQQAAPRGAAAIAGLATPRHYGATDGLATPVRAVVGAGLRGSGAVAAHLAELRARLAAAEPIMVRPYGYCVDVPGHMDTARHIIRYIATLV